jgi:hypothetical protein
MYLVGLGPERPEFALELTIALPRNCDHLLVRTEMNGLALATPI